MPGMVRGCVCILNAHPFLSSLKNIESEIQRLHLTAPPLRYPGKRTRRKFHVSDLPMGNNNSTKGVNHV